jgi:predicted Zn-dependent protease
MTETTTLTPAELFDNAIKDYQAGENPAKLIPIFVDICNRSPKLDSAWTCLSWLYLLENKPQLAIKAAQKSMKIDPFDAQTRINLAAGMLEIKQSGVREHIEMALRLHLKFTNRLSQTSKMDSAVNLTGQVSNGSRN